MDDREAPLLGEARVCALAREGALPDRWRMIVSVPSLRPVVRPGEVVLVTRGGPVRGALVCVAREGSVAWRWVLAVRGDEALLRASAAPFPDGWWSPVLGRAQLRGALPSLAARWPAAWTGATWWGAVGVSWARSLPGRARSWLVGEGGFTVRSLGGDDAEAFDSLHAQAFGASAGGYVLPPGRAVVGLFAPSGLLVGSVVVVLRDGEACLADLVVAPRWRGRGGGTLLAREGARRAREVGADVVRAFIAARNLASRAAFERAGFAWTGRWRAWPEDPWRAAERQWMEYQAG